MRLLQMYQIFTLFNCLLMIAAIGCGGYLLFPYIGLQVLPIGMVIFILFVLMDTLIYVGIYKAVRELDQI